MKRLLAVPAGAAVAVAVVFGIETLGHRVYPPPAGLELDDLEALKAYLGEAPAGVFGFLLAAWGLGTLAGATVAGRLGGPRPAAVVGLLLLVATVANLAAIPHPGRVAGGGVALVIAATALAVRGARARARARR